MPGSDSRDRSAPSPSGEGRGGVGAHCRQRAPKSALVLTALLAACAPTPFPGGERELVGRDLGDLDALQSRTLDRLSSAGAAAPAEALPDGTSPDDYVRLALAHSPELAAARQRVLRLRERIPQVTAPPDPMVEVTPIGEMARTAAGEVTVMTGVSQAIPYPGKLDALGRVADQESVIAGRELREREVEVAGEVRRAYWSLYAAERALELTAAARDLLAQIHAATEAQYRAGQGRLQDVLLAGVEVAETDSRLVELRADRAAAAAMLNSLADRPTDASAPVVSSAEPASIGAAFDALAADAAGANPRLAAIRERIELARRQRHVAHLQRYPDLVASVSYNLVDADREMPTATGDDQWSIGVGVSIPLWRGKLAAAEREATRGILEAAGELAAEQNRIAFRLRESLARLASQQEQATLLRDSIIPQARAALDASRAAYRTGASEFITTVDNWRRVLTLELMRERLVADTHAAAASIAEAVGRDPETKP
ncbi:MAG: TolC family protein [Phycisphaerae bacterium]|nr:TolC family protein [Phycisphaerae bacterium]